MNSFEENLLSIHSKLTNFALSLTNDKEKANDLTQDTLLRLLNSEIKYQERDNFKGWAFTVMRNLFINSYRKLSRFQTVDSRYLPLENISAFSIDEPDNVLNAGEIINIINQFAPGYRDPFALYMAGYSYQEIAEKIDIPLGTVKSRIFAIRTKLKSILEKGK